MLPPLPLLQFCDDVASLRDLGKNNTESLGELVMAFFNVSHRTQPLSKPHNSASILSKCKPHNSASICVCSRRLPGLCLPTLKWNLEMDVNAIMSGALAPNHM